MTSVPATHAVQTLGDVLKDAARGSAGSLTFHLDDGLRRLGVEEIHEMASERAAVLLATVSAAATESGSWAPIIRSGSAGRGRRGWRVRSSSRFRRHFAFAIPPPSASRCGH